MHANSSRHGLARTACLLVLAHLVVPLAVTAQLSTWNGGSATSDNWSDADNWGGTAPAVNDALAFGGTTRLTPSNDYATGTPFNGVSFLSGVGRFTLSGNAIALAGGITSAAMSNQTVNVGLALTADTAIHISANYSTARISLGGGISGDFGLTLSGTYQYGDNRVTFAGANTYTGTTTVGTTGNKVTAWVTNLAGIPGPVVVADGSTLRLRPTVTGGTFSPDISIIGQGAQCFGWPSWAGRSYAGSLVLNNDVKVAGTVTLTGDAVISAGRDDTGTTGMYGIITGKITGPYRVQFGYANERPGTIRISSPDNDWTGGTIVTGGGSTGSSGRVFVLELGADDVLPYGVGKGNLHIATNNSRVNTLNRVLNANGLSGGTSSMLYGGGTFTVGHADGGGDYNGSLTVTQLIKTGSGNQQLGGNSTVSGGVTVNGGTLTIDGGYLAGGAITVDPAASLVLDGATAELRYTSATDYSGPFTFTRGKLGGSNWKGGLSGLIVGSDRTVSPGVALQPATAQTGSQTWAPGGAYVFEINNATGAAGVNWDYLTVTGALDVSGLSSGSPFTVQLVSLAANNTAGLAPNFDPSASYEWEIVSAGSLSKTLSPEDVAVNTNGFRNVCSAEFWVKQDGSTLKVVYNVAKSQPGTLLTIR